MNRGKGGAKGDKRDRFDDGSDTNFEKGKRKGKNKRRFPWRRKGKGKGKGKGFRKDKGKGKGHGGFYASQTSNEDKNFSFDRSWINARDKSPIALMNYTWRIRVVTTTKRTKEQTRMPWTKPKIRKSSRILALQRQMQ